MQERCSWGNSQGVRIPKTLLENNGISMDDAVELASTDEGIIIRKAPSDTHETLEEYLEEFYGVPLAQISPLPRQTEIDWGNPVGNEI